MRVHRFSVFVPKERRVLQGDWRLGSHCQGQRVRQCQPKKATVACEAPDALAFDASDQQDRNVRLAKPAHGPDK